MALTVLLFIELMMSDCHDSAKRHHVFFKRNSKGGFSQGKRAGAYINLDDFTHIDYLDDLCGIPELSVAVSIRADISIETRR